MYTSFDRCGKGRRRGVILLIVIAMLTLFAAVGLAFVFYAEAEAVSSGASVQAQSKTVPDGDPELLLSYFLSQWIYGTDNPGSAIRGHDLGTITFGNKPNDLNVAAFSGSGRLHYPLDASANQLSGLDNYYYPNSQVYTNLVNPKVDNFRRDPEFYGTTASPSYGYRAGNAPYTYPDLNNMFLARVDADGSVILPSFRRKWAEQAISADLTADPNRRRYAFLYPDALGYHNGLDNNKKQLSNSSGDPLGSFSLADADLGGHVRNLEFSRGSLIGYDAAGNPIYANNDSYWLDLGWPVMIAPNGKKYKALFAPLIIDLDNRINLWVSGNQAGGPGVHLSNQGFGTTEINLKSVVSDQNELNWLFGQRPFQAQPPNLPTRDGSNYGRIDVDGVNGGKLQLPGSYGTAPNNLFVFPNFQQYPANPWYSATELQNHPLGFDYFGTFSSANNRPYRPSNSEAVLRHMGTGAPAATSVLFQNMAKSFANPTAANAAKTRNLITALSMCLDRVQAAPFINFNPATGAYAYDATRKYPISLPLTQADYSQPAPNAGASEFTADFRSKLANSVRTNLNRINSNAYDYPSPDADPNKIIDYANNSGTQPNAKKIFDKAQQARTDLARDIYQVLVLVTGAQDPNVSDCDASLAPFQGARWLAQLAVNIVDYIDNDDFITPYQWYSKPANSAFPNNPAYEFVYGTEVPRLVLNEVYVQLDNNPAEAVNLLDPTTWRAQTYNMNVWAELLNPFTSSAGDAFPYEGGKARLKVNGYDKTGKLIGLGAAYQVVLSKPNDPNLTVLSNTRGDYTQNQTPAASVANDMDQGNFETVDPASGSATGAVSSNQGYYVLGPKTTFLGQVTVDIVNNVVIGSRDPGLPTSYQSKSMSWQYGVADVDPTKPLPNPTVLLQRLACPYLPYQPDPAVTNPPYNPFVTVDYVTNTKTNNNVVFNAAGPLLNSLPPDQTNVKFSTAFASQGRLQPYAAARLFDQTVVQMATQPKNTFYAANTPSDAQFNWLVHLDRPLVNAMELLHVSGFFPYQLTQQFITFNANGSENLFYQHYAPWQDPQALIYRSLELLGVPNNLLGTYIGGRVPGKVNINTLNEIEIWRALCDQNAVSNFTPAQVDAMFASLIQSRTRNLMANSASTYVPGASDQPFKPFATGFIPGQAAAPPFAQYPTGAGLDDTLLRTTIVTPNPPNQPVAAPATQSLYGNLVMGLPNNAHPYQRMELLQKVFNNVGTTSNVFAVWLTVGFFDVQDVDSAGNAITPAKIGSEIGRDQGKQIRHRMFAIVDRTNMQLFSTTGSYDASKSQLTLTAPNGITLPQGVTLLLDVKNAAGVSEVVSVTATAKNAWTFNAVLQTIGTGAVTIGCRGNPGPQPTYNPRNDSLVVPHFTIIQ